jgi:AcrR family transcriptional regulator
MAKVRTPRAAWITAATQALADGGPGAVRVEVLAASLGVSKGGFYWHFANRDALLDEVLEAWETAMVDDVITQVSAATDDPRAMIRHLFELAPTADFAVELALREWSRHDRGVARRMRRVDRRRMAWLRSIFGQLTSDPDEIDARSMLAYSLLIGSWFIIAHPDRRTRLEQLRRAREHLLR